jgi:hypothetical protein
MQTLRSEHPGKRMKNFAPVPRASPHPSVFHFLEARENICAFVIRGYSHIFI